MFHASVQRIADGLNVKHWMSIHYKNSWDYITGKFPLGFDKKTRTNVEKIKAKMDKYRSEIRELENHLLVAEKVLQDVCTHPVDDLIHSGYSVSGSSKKFDGFALKEWVSCPHCNYKHDYETPSSENYNDDY